MRKAHRVTPAPDSSGDYCRSRRSVYKPSRRFVANSWMWFDSPSRRNFSWTGGIGRKSAGGLSLRSRCRHRALRRHCGGQLRHNEDMESVVVRNSAIMSGAPTFRGTRVLVRTLFEYLEAGHSLERFLERSEERRVGKECRSRWSPH